MPVVYTDSNYRVAFANPRYFPKNVVVTEEDEKRLQEFIKARRIRKAKFKKHMKRITEDTKRRTCKQISSHRKGH